MKLKVQKREILGKKVKNLRREGLVPVVVYGKGLSEPQHLSCDRIEFIKFYKKFGTSTPITLEGDGIEQMALVYDIQLDPVSNTLIHVDFIAIQKGQKVATEVSLVLTGEAPIEKSGEYQVQLLKDAVEIEAIPSKLPKELTIDISGLTEPNMTIHLGDIVIPEGVELLEDKEETIVTLVQLGGPEEELKEDDSEGEGESDAVDTAKEEDKE